MEISGDLNHINPELSESQSYKFYRNIIFNGGTIKCHGNYTQSGDYNQIIMNSEDDQFFIDGDATFGATQYSSENLKTGSIFIKGDINNKTKFVTSGEHKLILCGDKKQSVKFIQGSSLASLINRNTSKEDVEIVNDIQVTNKISDTGNNISGNGNVLLNSLDQIENNYSGNVYLKPVNCKVNSNTNIGGKLTIQSDFDLNGKYLKTGSLEILNGIFDVNGGNLEVSDSMNVEGSYTFDDNERNAIFDVNGGNVVIGGNCSFAGYSHLKMLNAKDNILVNGNFAVNSNIDSENELTNGVLEVKGDFTQAGNSTNFRPTANHRVKLSGKADENNLQKIIPYSSKSLYFNILEINKNEPELFMAQCLN